MKNLAPPVQVLRMKQLSQIIGYSPSTIYDLIAKGKFPPPFKLVSGGRAAGWLESDVDTWILTRKADAEVGR